MRESASRGFWVTPNPPYGYRKVYVQDGPKRRPRLEVNEKEARVVRHIFEMALQGKSTLDITKTLNREGIASPRGKQWLKTSVHNMLNNEAYTGTLVWGTKARDGAPPVRVNEGLSGPGHQAKVPPRWLPFCGLEVPQDRTSQKVLQPLPAQRTSRNASHVVNPSTASEAKSGRYTYYVCRSLLMKGRAYLQNPQAQREASFEGLIVENIRENILTETNIRDLGEDSGRGDGRGGQRATQEAEGHQG